MRGPQLPIADVCCKKPIVQAVQVRSHGSEGRNAHWRRSGAHCNRNICGDAWRSAGIADAPHDQPAKRRITLPDDVTLGGVRIVVINAARAVRSVCGDQTAKRGNDDGAAAEHRTLLNHIDVGIAKILRRRIEHVPADVERVGVDPE